MNAFALLKDQDISLSLILYGFEKDKQQVKNLIASSHKKDLIRTYSGLEYAELIDLYMSARGLLIPIQPSVRDAARFPHKIGEYTAAASPIITTAFGEVNNCFEDRKNALIAQSFDPKEFAYKMDFVIKEPAESERIGLAGRSLGEQKFNYQAYGSLIEKFIIKVVSK